MKTWSKWVLVGVVSILFGLVVLSAPVVASVSMTLLTGILFAAAGAFQLLGGISEPGAGNKVLNVLLGVLTLVLGLSFVTNPLQGTVSLALLVTVLLAAGGVMRMFLAWQMRTTQFFWGMLISGACSILLAGLIFADFSTLSTKILGIFLGVELLLNGVGLIVLGIFLRRHPEIGRRGE